MRNDAGRSVPHHEQERRVFAAGGSPPVLLLRAISLRAARAAARCSGFSEKLLAATLSRDHSPRSKRERCSGAFLGCQDVFIGGVSLVRTVRGGLAKGQCLA